MARMMGVPVRVLYRGVDMTGACTNIEVVRSLKGQFSGYAYITQETGEIERVTDNLEIYFGDKLMYRSPVKEEKDDGSYFRWG